MLEYQNTHLQLAIDKTSRLLKTRQVVGGNRVIKDRMISIYNPESRLIERSLKRSYGTKICNGSGKQVKQNLVC